MKNILLLLTGLILAGSVFNISAMYTPTQHTPLESSEQQRQKDQTKEILKQRISQAKEDLTEIIKKLNPSCKPTDGLKPNIEQSLTDINIMLQIMTKADYTFLILEPLQLIELQKKHNARFKLLEIFNQCYYGLMTTIESVNKDQNLTHDTFKNLLITLEKLLQDW